MLRAPLKIALAGTCLAALFLAAPPAQGAFPGANGKIAFVSDRDGSLQIYAVDAAGGGTTQLTSGPGPNTHPAWSADGQRIAFRCELNGEAWICVMNGDGTGRAPVFVNSNLGDATEPTWSPDGSRIAFAWERETCDDTMDCNLQFDIGVMNADGTGVSALGRECCSETSPAWHPDGSKIAYNGLGLETIRPDGTGRTTIAAGSYPNWSPDGSRIAYARYEGGNSEIFVADADGSNEVRLTSTTVNDSDPAWSPDGTKLTFTSDQGGDAELFLMNSDGTGRVALTDNPGADGGPDWQPIPGPKRGDYKNAAQFCRAERDFLGEGKFRQKYGGGANAYGKCVSAK